MFSFSVSSFSVEMSSASPSGSEGADPVLVTDNEESIAVSDIGSMSSVSRKSARRSASRLRSVSLERFQKLELSAGQTFASIESFMSRFDQAAGSLSSRPIRGYR